MESLAESWFFWIALIAGLAVLYVLPTVIAVIRQVRHLGYVIALNFIAVGWPAALIGAIILSRRQPRRPPDLGVAYEPNHHSARPGSRLEP